MMRRTGWIGVMLWLLSGGAARAQTPVVTKAVDVSTGVTTDVGDATDHAIRVKQVPGGTEWTFNWTLLLGAAPSATNPMPSRLTDGTTYIDPRSVRALTSSDVVTVVQGTGSNLHVVVDTAPTTAVTGTFWPATQPVSLPASVTTSGTFLTASAGSVVLSGLTSMASAYVRVSVNSTTGPPSVNFDVSVDGGATFVPIKGTLRTSAGAFSTAVSTTLFVSTSTHEAWFTLPSGATDVRVKDAGGSTGATVTVFIGASAIALQQFPGVTQVGSWSMTATQGAAGSNASAWWTRIGDATNGPVAVKAASTAAAATDPALVVRSIQLPAAVGAAATAASLPVTIANDQTVPVSGPATDTQLRATPLPVSFTNQSVNLNQVGGASFALGQQLAAASLPIVLTAAQLTTLTPPAAITGFALDATLTNRTAKTIITDGTNDATVKAASTLPAATDKALVVTLRESLSTAVTGPLTDTQLRASAVPVSLASAPTTAVTNAGLTNLDVALSTRTKPADQQHTIIDSGTTTVTQATGTNLHVQLDAGAATIGALTANQSVNHTQIGGATIDTGMGASTTGTQRTTLAQEPTYGAGMTAATATAAGTGIFWEMCGSATKTVRVQKLVVSGTVATGVKNGDVILTKHSAATSAGTATTLTQVPYDSNAAAGTATNVRFFTVLGTAGTSVGVVQNGLIYLPVTGTGTLAPPVEFVWRDQDSEAPTLRGTAQCLTLNFGTSTTNAPSLMVSARWTEK
jgi:hypothetical protein